MRDGETLEELWTLLLAIAARRRGGSLPDGPVGMHRDGELDAADERAWLIRHAEGTFAAGTALSGEGREFVELYLPLLSASAERPFVLAHLGQSVDNCIATASGDSHTVTGHEDFVHMHRLRALSDAIVIGGGTVAADDPTLTTRLVLGPSPVRVVLDPGARLPAERGVFRDGLAPTLHLTDALSPPAVLERLRARGLHAVFVEGGGVTVTRWIEAGVVDRLQVTLAPVLIGRGRAGLALPGAASMADSLRPDARIYRLGQDILWDFDLRTAARPPRGEETHPVRLV